LRKVEAWGSKANAEICFPKMLDTGKKTGRGKFNRKSKDGGGKTAFWPEGNPKEGRKDERRSIIHFFQDRAGREKNVGD